MYVIVLVVVSLLGCGGEGANAPTSAPPEQPASNAAPPTKDELIAILRDSRMQLVGPCGELFAGNPHTSATG